jgi:acylaminoacyl-peptidase
LGSQNILCLTRNGDAIVSQSEPNSPPSLGFISSASLLREGTEALRTQQIAYFGPVAATSKYPAKSVIENSDRISYHVIRTHPDHGDVRAPVEGILLLPPTSEKVPLVVVPHGGPHSCTPTVYVPSYAYLCQTGKFGILHVNYRGSSGFGQAALESLAGTVGDQDVKDVVHLTNHVLKEYEGKIDASKVGVCGGSHGGFLAGHLIGQYPDLFKVAAMRNPVTNIATMTTATDIPDWTYVECFGPGTYDWTKFRGPNKDDLAAMWDASRKF